jgi:hypothetical protein
MFLLATAAMGVVVLLLGIPQIFGVSLSWGWGAVDEGHTTLRAYTPKLAHPESRSVFVREREEFVATYNFELDSGRARLSVYTWGWLPAWGDLEVFHQDADIRSPTSKEVRIVAPRSGFYKVSGAVVGATGTFSIDWHVERARISGQALRALGLVLRLWPLLLAVLLVAALALVRLRSVLN